MSDADNANPQQPPAAQPRSAEETQPLRLTQLDSPRRPRQHQQPQQPGQGWEPLPQGGEYDADATAFVQLPEGLMTGYGGPLNPSGDPLDGPGGDPLAAPGHGYTPPSSFPDPASYAAPGAGADPSAAGQWTMPFAQSGQAPQGAAPLADRPPVGADAAWPASTDGGTGQWPAPGSGDGGTGQWSIPAVPDEALEESGEYLVGDGRTGAPAGGHPGAYGSAAGTPAAPDPALTGQWTFPAESHAATGHPAPPYEEPGRGTVSAAELSHAHGLLSPGPEQTAPHGTAGAQSEAPAEQAPQPGATGHWSLPFEATGQWTLPTEQAPPSDVPPPQPAGDPSAATGQWRIPVAGDELADHSGEFVLGGVGDPPGDPLAGDRFAGDPFAVGTDTAAGTDVAPPPVADEGEGAAHGVDHADHADAATPVAQAGTGDVQGPDGLTPEAPDAPEVTDAADVPGTPAVPDDPAVADGVDIPSAPAVPDTPGVPEAATPEEAPATPDAPATPTVTAEGAPAVPAAASLEAAAPTDLAPPAAPAPPTTPAEPVDCAESIEPVEPVEPPDPYTERPHASYVLRVNGIDRPVTDAWIGESLLYVLRERLGLAGAKDGCSQGECGACSVQVDGRLVASCLVPAATAAGSEVRTVEGLAEGGAPSDVQCALAASGAVQCGFCVPGMAMTVHDLLEGNHAPTELETRQALCGNLCRCSGYRGVLDAVRDVVQSRAAAAEAAAGSEATGQPAGPEAREGARIPHQAGPADLDGPHGPPGRGSHPHGHHPHGPADDPQPGGPA